MTALINIILGLLALGWTVNCATHQARGKVRMSLFNGAFALAAMAVLVWRLS